MDASAPRGRPQGLFRQRCDGRSASPDAWPRAQAHSHTHEQIAYIVSGTIRFFIGGEEHLVGPGGLVLIPSNVEHWGEVVGDEPVINLDVFTPRRPEYA